MFIVAYDIASDRRLRRVARLMKGYGTRVQRSVFECHLDREQLAELMREMKTVIRRREDRVQVYHLCGACQQRFEIYGEGGLTPMPEVYLC